MGRQAKREAYGDKVAGYKKGGAVACPVCKGAHAAGMKCGGKVKGKK